MRSPCIGKPSGTQLCTGYVDLCFVGPPYRVFLAMPAAVSRYFEVAENSPSASTRPSFAAWIAVFNPTPSGKLLNARGPRAMIRVRSLLYAMRVRCFLVFWLPQPDRTMPVRGAVHGQPTFMRRHPLSAKPRLFAICSEQILINENPAAMSGRKGAAGSSLSRWARGKPERAATAAIASIGSLNAKRSVS